ncbi:DUF3027 domain-containing protein [Dietzia sp.]|uniref:DUF3027 domain-containing protein n=1 Tax=Dietzia sp. TaxID=1871616 RepID=UPI002FD9D49A
MTDVTERSEAGKAPGRGDEGGAIATARAAAIEVAGAETVGEHVRAVVEAENTTTHFFESILPGYRGWQWACVLSDAGDRTTIDEIALLPGPDALLAPEWVPWVDRLHAGDVGPGDLLPVDEVDERLAPGYELVDDGAEDLEDNAVPLGLGRERVLSYEGRVLTAERWQEGPNGPDSETAKLAEHSCGTCGFLVSIAGSLGHAFGVCANEFSADGQVVSLDYGCGAHSAVRDEQSGPGAPVGSPVDDHALDFDPAPGAADDAEGGAVESDSVAAASETVAADSDVPAEGTAE